MPRAVVVVVGNIGVAEVQDGGGTEMSTDNVISSNVESLSLGFTAPLKFALRYAIGSGFGIT